MGTMTSVRPIVSETAEGYKLTGDGIVEGKKYQLTQAGDPKASINMETISRVLAEAVDWDKAQGRANHDGGNARETTGALNGSYTADGYRYTIGLSVTRKKVTAKDNGFALMSDADIDAAVASVENLLTIKAISPAQAQKSLNLLPKKRGQ